MNRKKSSMKIGRCLRYIQVDLVCSGAGADSSLSHTARKGSDFYSSFFHSPVKVNAMVNKP